MPVTITPEGKKELDGLWPEYWGHTEAVLRIMRSEGTEGAAVPKIVEEDSKAGAAIKRIQEILRGEGKSTSIPGATKAAPI